MPTVRSVCGRCHNACRIIALVEKGILKKVKGDPDDPRTQGTLCSKGLSATQIAYDPRRLRHPLRRVGPRGRGKWEQTSWDDALTEIAGKFNDMKKKYGPRSVGFLRGQGALWGFQYLMLQRFCNAFGTAPGMGASECFVPRVAAEVVTYGGVPLYSDYENAKMLIYWGRQPSFSTATLMRRIFDARDRGAKIVVIDVLKFHLGARADQFIFIEPGTDMALALAMMTVIVEENLWDHEFVNRYTNDPGLTQLREHLNGGNRDGVRYSPEWAESITGIEAAVIRNLAREYATTPSCINIGHGIEGKTNIAQTGRAIALLRVITGHLDQKGCDVMVPPSPNFNPKFFFNHLAEPTYQEPDDLRMFGNSHTFVPEGCTYPLLFMVQGLYPTPDVLRDLRDGTMKATFIQGGNPLLMLPNPNGVRDAFLKAELNVVCELYQTATTTAVADIVLPAASYLERTEPEWFKAEVPLPIVNLRRKLIQVGECRSDSQILIDLARTLGLEAYFPSPDITYYIEDLFTREKFSYRDLEESKDGVAFGTVMYDKPGRFGINLPGGKAHIVSEILEGMGFDALPVYYEGAETSRSTPEIARAYPLNALTGRAGPMYVHSELRTIPWLKELNPEPFVMINPAKALELDIKNNDLVLVESPRGFIKLKAHLTETISPSSVYIPGGWEEANYNIMGIEEDLCPITSQANYMQCLCRVSRISERGGD